MPESVRWVDNQNHRWGSCTPGDRTDPALGRLQGMPAWVIDYVLVHELAHLLEPGPRREVLGLGRPLPAGRAGQGLPAGLVGRRPARPAAGPRTSTEPLTREPAPARRARPGPSGSGSASTGHQRTSSDSSLTACSASGGGDRHEPDVEVVDAAAGSQNGTACSLSCTGTGSSPEPGDPGLLGRLALGRAGQGRRRPARSGRRTGTTAGLGVQGQQHPVERRPRAPACWR